MSSKINLPQFVSDRVIWCLRITLPLIFFFLTLGRTLGSREIRQNNNFKKRFWGKKCVSLENTHVFQKKKGVPLEEMSLRSLIQYWAILKPNEAQKNSSNEDPRQGQIVCVSQNLTENIQHFIFKNYYHFLIYNKL